MELPDIGFTMKLPPGWVNARETKSSAEYKQFYKAGVEKDDYWENVSISPLEIHDLFTGKTKKVNTLTEYVDDILKDQEKISAMFGTISKALGKIVGEEIKEASSVPIKSRTQGTISGYEAIEVILNAPISVIKVYIRKDDKIIEISFMVSKEEFPKYEEDFRKSIESIKIK
ncbi:MAG: hypothetical protein NC830_06725 [Candidatus Omnitrophica bacterium]|nr:hypothetical protein [Candidatus Omnitrophota bacterium]